MMFYVIGYIFGTFVGVVLHEIGHAVAARINGWPIKGFRIGKPPFIWQGAYREIKFEFGLLPNSGQVFCLPDMHASKFKFIFLYSSGLIVNTIIFLAAYGSFIKSEPESGYFLLGVAASQAVLIFLNLFPVVSKTVAPNHDGRNIWKYITSKQTPFEIWTTNLNLIYAPYAEATETKFEPSELMYEFGRITLEKKLMTASEFIDKRLVVLEKLQKKLSHSNAEELHMLDSIITDILLHDFENNKTQLGKLAERAISVGAHSTAILQTYRSVLVEIGRFDQALTYFNAEEEKSKSNLVAALNLIYRARAENGAGDKSLAMQLAQEAKNLVSRIPQATHFQNLLNRMDAELQSGKDP